MRLYCFTYSSAPARISSFSQTLRQALKTNVILRCIAVGNPTPTIKWLYNKEPVRTDSDSTFSVQLGSLHIGSKTRHPPH